MYTLDELGSLYEACIDGDLMKVFEYVDEDPEIINVPLNDVRNVVFCFYLYD
jgi:hypothetical protein